MKKIESLQVKFHNRKVGTLTLTADKKCCVFEYAQFKQKQRKVKMREMNYKWLRMSNIS